MENITTYLNMMNNNITPRLCINFETFDFIGKFLNLLIVEFLKQYQTSKDYDIALKSILVGDLYEFAKISKNKTIREYISKRERHDDFEKDIGVIFSKSSVRSSMTDYLTYEHAKASGDDIKLEMFGLYTGDPEKDRWLTERIDKYGPGCIYTTSSGRKFESVSRCEHVRLTLNVKIVEDYIVRLGVTEVSNEFLIELCSFIEYISYEILDSSAKITQSRYYDEEKQLKTRVMEIKDVILAIRKDRCLFTLVTLLKGESEGKWYDWLRFFDIESLIKNKPFSGLKCNFKGKFFEDEHWNGKTWMVTIEKFQLKETISDGSFRTIECKKEIDDTIAFRREYDEKIKYLAGIEKYNIFMMNDGNVSGVHTILTDIEEELEMVECDSESEKEDENEESEEECEYCGCDKSYCGHTGDEVDESEDEDEDETL